MKPVIIIAIAFVLLFPITAFAQTYTGVLTLDSIPSNVKTGEIITFSGILTTTDGRVVQDATIYIKDDVNFDIDTVLGTVTTDDRGKFSASWEAVPRSSGSYDFYAIYEGGGNISKSKSVTYTVTVGASSGSTSNPGTSSSNTYLPTTITLDRLPSSIYAGKSITFTGKLTSLGSPVSNAIVKIMEDDPLVPDQTIVTGRTDSNGKFSIPWTVSGGYVEQDFDIYSTFNNDSKYSYARSYNQEMSILRYGGSITLDRIQPSAEIGETVQFSGTLQLNQGSSEGAIVYIKDEDPFTGDDLLATAYVDGSGRFSANWFVNYVDADDVADIYAVFEGNNILARQTTCDTGSTMPIGGSCLNTMPLRTTISTSLPPPLPPTGTGTTNPTLSGNEYMKLYYSLDLNRNPKVAIIPSPDSYDEARRHVGSVQEGIKMWESALDRKFGGTWNITFEVIKPGTLFFNNQPDIVVNIVTADEDSKCLSEYSGWAKIWRGASKPVQTQVCTTSPDVGATAAHEFIHAMGLGHAFNKKGDLMCSAELVGGQWIPTCPSSFSRSSIPSDFNLAATGFLYNSDGFKNPNNRVSYESKFTTSDYLGGNSVPITNPVSPNPSKPITPPTTTVTPPNTTSDYDDDGIPDYKDECKYIKENYNGYEDTDGCLDLKPLEIPTNDGPFGSNTDTSKAKVTLTTESKDITTNTRLSAQIKGNASFDTEYLTGMWLDDVTVVLKTHPDGKVLESTTTGDKFRLGYFSFKHLFPRNTQSYDPITGESTWKIFVEFAGDSKNSPAKSEIITITVLGIPEKPVLEKPSELRKIQTLMNIFSDKIGVTNVINEGDTIDGELFFKKSNIGGNPQVGISDRTIILYDYDSEDSKKILSTITTDGYGNFKWNVERNPETYQSETGKSKWRLWMSFEGDELYGFTLYGPFYLNTWNPDHDKDLHPEPKTNEKPEFCFLFWCW